MQRSHEEEREAAPQIEAAGPEMAAAAPAEQTRFVGGSVPPVETAQAVAGPTASERAFGADGNHGAAGWQRQLWRLTNSDPVAQKLLDNYMDGTGAAVTLNGAEMQGCNPHMNIKRSKAFMALVDSLRERGGGTSEVNVNGLGAAMTNGTLGNFTVIWRGSVTVRADGAWSFTGTASFHDYWDFDPKSFGAADRPFLAELKVRFASMMLPGKPFHIFSEQIDVSQSSTEAAAGLGNHAQIGSHVDNPTFMLDSTTIGETLAAGTVGASLPALAGGAAVGGAVGGAFVDASLANGNKKPPS